MAGDTLDTFRLRSAFGAEVKRATRATAVAGGLIAIVAFPVWAGFDHLVDPSHGAEFTALRLSLELPLVALWLSLFTQAGRRHPELVMLLFLGLIQAAIAFMTSRVDEAHAPYALGLSLAIYASSFLLIWPWQYTAALIGLTWVALAVAIGTAPQALDASAIATIAFYLGTASLVAFVGQLHRQMTAWQEFRSRLELELEQERNRQLLEQLERLSREDSLTGLANRRCWDETLSREFERARRQDGRLAVLLCDLDRLKEINDRFGHATGDWVLKAAADVLRERVRAGDLAARLGGEEFTVLCPDTDFAAASALAEDLRARLGELRPGEVATAEVTVSIGVACREPVDLSPTELVLRADDRLYRAKRTRNAVYPNRVSSVA
ncbi:MAG: GGDEF domain-containing protein [Thermoleophilaceae bacterium]|nr:GGDEF domain-containing protein [Thermoleophilaceae bacterium]